MFLFPIPILGLTFKSDKEFSEALCKQDDEACAEFMDLYSDELYFVAARFNNRGTPEESWDYRTKKGYHIKVSDSVADTYVWLFKSIVLNKSCKFEGINGASFESFIKTVLNSDWTFISWRRWKTDDSLIKVPGATGYIPKVIKNMDDTTVEVFKLLRQHKSKDTICSKLNLQQVDVDSYCNQIEKALIDTNQLQLIYSPKISSTDKNQDEDEEKSLGYELQDGASTAPSSIPEVELIKDLVSSVLETITNEEKKIITLWASDFSAENIYEELSTISFLKKYKSENKIKNSGDIYPLVEKIVTKLIKIVKKDYYSIQIDYNIDKSRMKRLLKTYYSYFL